MRLWTLHPQYLDAKGLVAAWREGLLAQKVIAGATKGYRHHPQLIRFQTHAEPAVAIAEFLRALADEATHRGYHFDATKIPAQREAEPITETRGQLLYEWEHLRAKLRVRSPEVYRRIRGVKSPEPHPLFKIVPGEIRAWEIR